MKLCESIGELKYSNNPYKLILEVDQGISDYYRSMIPKYYKVNRQLYNAHISIVRKEIPVNLQYWNKYQGKELKFEYEPFVYFDETYFWLNCYLKEIQDIRIELGLGPSHSIVKSPDGKHDGHMTIGNMKK